MNAQFTDSTPVGGTAAAATQVVVTITGVALKRTRLTFLSLGYSAAAPAAPTQATISDGTTTIYLAVGSTQAFIDALAMVWATGATVTITLPSGGGSTVGCVAAAYYQDGVS